MLQMKRLQWHLFGRRVEFMLQIWLENLDPIYVKKNLGGGVLKTILIFN